MTNIEGQWTGVITLGKEYRDRKNEKILFDLNMIQNKTKVNGTALDIAGSCINPEAANFFGSFKKNEINFIKQYPSIHFFKDGKLIIDRSKPGPEIFYTGGYNETTQTFTGKWVMKNKITVFCFFISFTKAVDYGKCTKNK